MTFSDKRNMTAEEIDEISGLEKPVLLAAHPAYIINTAAMNQLEEIYGGKTEDYPEGWTEAGFADLGVEYRREVVVDGYFADKTDQLKEILHDGLLENSAAGITTYSSHTHGHPEPGCLHEAVSGKSTPHSLWLYPLYGFRYEPGRRRILPAYGRSLSTGQ